MKSTVPDARSTPGAEMDGYAGENLIFIVGCPRSGTTWLQRLLASHPSVKTGQESHLFSDYVGRHLRTWNKRSVSPEEPVRGTVGMHCYLRDDGFKKQLRGYMLGLLEPMIGDLQPGEFFSRNAPAHALDPRDYRASPPLKVRPYPPRRSGRDGLARSRVAILGARMGAEQRL